MRTCKVYLITMLRVQREQADVTFTFALSAVAQSMPIYVVYLHVRCTEAHTDACAEKHLTVICLVPETHPHRSQALCLISN